MSAAASAAAGAPQADPELAGAGRRNGVEVWRVENRRGDGAGMAATFGVARWPEDRTGDFYRGDSYLVLLTAELSDGKKEYDIFFWLGSESSQDERAVAAVKAVELDSVLGGRPVQHRETEGKESQLFQSMFRSIRYLDGGIESGFTHAKPEEYEPKLFQVKKTKHTTRAFQVPLSVKSMHQGDCFVLDLGKEVTAWHGTESSPFERAKAADLQDEIVASRHGHALKGESDDAAFWEALGGTEVDVGPAIHDTVDASDIDPANCNLYRLSDATGSMKFTHERAGESLAKSMLDESDVFIVDAQVQLFVWIGAGASDEEKAQSMDTAITFLSKHGRPSYTPVSVIKQGQTSAAFRKCFA